jgi:thiosulfate dehydrogenase
MRLKWFLLGVLITLVVLVPLGMYAIASLGLFPISARSKPLPFEEYLAMKAVHRSAGQSAAQQNPLPVTSDNLLAGARVYRENCAICHGLPNREPGSIAMGMSPKPPGLFDKDDMITDDPDGVAYWVISNGIRLSGMPSFAGTLTDQQRWQLAMLLTRADKLPAEVLDSLKVDVK